MTRIPSEPLIFKNLDLNAEVETIEQAAMSCAIAQIAHQIALRKTRLALIRHRQAELQLAQHLQSHPHLDLEPL
jgi:hypothetical protein